MREQIELEDESIAFLMVRAGYFVRSPMSKRVKVKVITDY
ncbi:unnamed protein product [Haemonchus placei]|uniref:Nucleotide exchange factor GrpE n=1 Tax=Haemonchus placei TaxID=6290 RepID=A0A0N4WAA0_HAEPC|nr:unnamed protein product [Haemonchus placei]